MVRLRSDAVYDVTPSADVPHGEGEVQLTCLRIQALFPKMVKKSRPNRKEAYLEKCCQPGASLGVSWPPACTHGELGDEMCKFVAVDECGAIEALQEEDNAALTEKF
ncbi:hypothetical protein M405DRAFT_886070 [Rhizopogon salebrosus TDB-379]|nr:hypothetical protein M405DRAFT_886070 [Rhizopogon salebrosus TDB-379]